DRCFARPTIRPCGPQNHFPKRSWKPSRPNTTHSPVAGPSIAHYSLRLQNRAHNSAVECNLHTAEVTGSNPVAPTKTKLAILGTTQVPPFAIAPPEHHQSGVGHHQEHHLARQGAFRWRRRCWVVRRTSPRPWTFPGAARLAS